MANVCSAIPERICRSVLATERSAVGRVRSFPCTVLQRRWPLSGAFASPATYTVFDKAIPIVLPAGQDIAFPIAALVLIGLEYMRMSGRRRAIANKTTAWLQVPT